jgi:ribokinase
MTHELVSFADISSDVMVRVHRLPGPDEKQSATLIGEFPGGMGANVAAAFARLGGRAALVSSVGDDERGRRSVAELRAAGVDVTHVTTVADATFWTIALIDSLGEKSLVEFPSRASSPPWEGVDWSVLDGARIAHTVGAEGRQACRLFDECRRRGVTTALDVESADLDDQTTVRALLDRTDVLFAPDYYAEAITGTAVTDEAARGLLATGPSVVAVTLGRRGCLVAARPDRILEVPGHAVAAVDTTGAGDCFAGAFLYASARGWDVGDCARLATLMAAQSVTAYGSRGRLLSLAELAELPEAARLPLDRAET